MAKPAPKYLFLFLVVALVGMVSVVGIVALTQQKGLTTSTLYGQAASTAGGSSQDSGHIWDVLKKTGLQGFHYTLNIHGKTDTYNKQDCTVYPDPVTGQYSNNIFIPSNGDSADNNQIIMMSGNVKGKWAQTGAIYGVRDACTAPIDGDAAELIIPPSEKGYFVVARVLGKPTNNPELYLEGNLMWVQDEYGNDLLVLGLVTDNGFYTPSTTLTRAKGNVRAVDITGLFEWSGNVCYFNGANYCYDSLNNYICTNTNLCCTDSNADGIIDSCVAPSLDEYGIEYCTEGFALTTLGCRDYLNEWVFNIGDFVGYMWETYATGDFKLANIRFYPVQ